MNASELTPGQQVELVGTGETVKIKSVEFFSVWIQRGGRFGPTSTLPVSVMTGFVEGIRPDSASVH